MEQDLRELFEKEREKKIRMKSGHEARFMNRLDKEMPPEKRANTIWLWSVAATVLIVFGIGIYFLGMKKDLPPVDNTVVTVEQKDKNAGISLGDLSPELQKVENYYMANINLELSKLEVSPSNKELVDSYLEQLAALNQEYNFLNKELNTLGPNDQTITALIKNLQLRLKLLLKLKEKLNQIKSSKNEQ
ncbi:MAG: hypothetical protein KJO94_05510, partial [Eudoraea sp.]|nr:hypothetical protein [Eudoraea sp.]